MDTPNNDIPDNPEVVPISSDDATDSTTTSEGASGVTSPSSNPVTNPREENPFSFRHFLRRTQNSVPTVGSPTDQLPRMSAEEVEANRFGGARPKTRTQPRQGYESDLKSPCGLPDFVQDHLVMESSNGYQHIPDRGLGDDGQMASDNPLDLPRNNSPIHAAGAMPIPLDIANLASSSNDDVIGTLDLANLNNSSGEVQQPEEPVLPGPEQDHHHEINNNENVNSLSQLPDFLSDGPMQQQQQGRMNPSEPIESIPSGSQPNLLDENSRLRQQLEVALANERAASLRNERLEALLSEHRRRESEEAKSLEESMGQIENNLKMATQRAVQSESQLAQMKKENRRLQDEVKSLQEALRLEYHGEASPRNNQLSQTAAELHTAANSAERSIRDLLAGVEHLRVVASSLESMERIEQIQQRPRRDK